MIKRTLLKNKRRLSITKLCVQITHRLQKISQNTPTKSEDLLMMKL